MISDRIHRHVASYAQLDKKRDAAPFRKGGNHLQATPVSTYLKESIDFINKRTQSVKTANHTL